ncbi:hypothetical protein [Crassaminicella profunda]|nr:hypothetical protein [Crassaminicella profunda]QZY54009.1 hypothetical protein K7H06_13200 [Crassaminicella profunda]
MKIFISGVFIDKPNKFLMGQTIKAYKGKVNPKLAKEILEKK